MVSRHKIPFHEKTLGQLFCDRSARDIVAMLELECRQAGVQVFLNSPIEAVRRGSAFQILTSHANFSAPALVVATGGLSIPKMGATSLGYDLACQFGIAVRECRPALVPLLFAPQELDQYGDLAGLSTEIIAACDTGQFREKMLITHRGLSGPAIL